MLSDAFMRVLGHFTVTNETQRLDTVQKIFINFGSKCANTTYISDISRPK